jgi:hypothetical protein
MGVGKSRLMVRCERIALCLSVAFVVPPIVVAGVWMFAGLFNCDPGDWPEQAKCSAFGLDWSQTFHELYWHLLYLSLVGFFLLFPVGLISMLFLFVLKLKQA